MEHEGSSRGSPEKRERRMSVEEIREVGQKNESPMKSRPRKNDDDTPEDSEDEDSRAQIAGPRNYPPPLWHRLNNPPTDRPVLDHWEFKLEGECMAMTFICDGEKYPMYFSPRSAIDYQMRANYWVPRHNPVWRAFRTRLYSLPRNLRINRMVFFNTPDCEAEDCLIELMFIKKWHCRQLEYNVCTEFSQPQHLRKLIQMFKPTEIMINLNFGPYLYNNSSNDPSIMHNHISANFDTTFSMERDFRNDCQSMWNADITKREVQNLYGEAGKAKAFGNQMLRTFCALRKIVTLMTDRKMAKELPVRKFIINGPAGDKICSKLAQLFKEEGNDESTRRRQQYASGEKIFICVRNDLRRAYKYSISMPASSFKMDIGNEQLLAFTKNVPVFHCLFRTNIDAVGVIKLIEEWQKNERNFDDLQVHIDKVIEPTFVDHLGAEHGDGKRIKIKRLTGNKRHTLFIEKERLATRHLSVRIIESKDNK